MKELIVLTFMFLCLTGEVMAAAGDLDTSFSNDGKLITDFSSGSDLAYAIAVQPDGKIVVAGQSSSNGPTRFATARYLQNGMLDATFDGDGRVLTDVGSGHDKAYAIALQPDGKIVVGGQSYNGIDYDFALVRYNPDGSLDQSFSRDGKIITDISGMDNIEAIAIQQDGKIVVAGWRNNGSPSFDFALARYTSNGEPDLTFSGDGQTWTHVGGNDEKAYGVAVQGDGKIVVAGHSNANNQMRVAVLRYLSNGSLDNTFSNNGYVLTDVANGRCEGFAMAIQPLDGKIVVGGRTRTGLNVADFALVRYNTDGSLDTTFSADGKVVTDVGGNAERIESVVIQTNGRIAVAGITNSGNNLNFALARYLPGGQLDITFSSDGKLISGFVTNNVDYAYGLAIQPADGRLVAAGYTCQGNNCGAGAVDFGLARFHAYTCAGLNVTRIGSFFGDLINGSSSDDVILGLGGNDTIHGDAGNDTLCGDVGDDFLNGGTGTDTCSGGAGLSDSSVDCEAVTAIP